jgi:hypothetical protein
MSMRLPLTLLCGLVLAPAAVAATHATGDGVLELKAVNATKVVIQGSRGAIWGQLDKGTLRVVDPNPDDKLVALVSGAEQVRPTIDPGVTIYSGTNIHFRFSGSKYGFSIVGTGIDVTAVGVGKAWLTGVGSLDDGDYAVDDGKWQPVPFLKKLVTFGVQPVPTTTTP